jgi:hypothetical protein
MDVKPGLPKERKWIEGVWKWDSERRVCTWACRTHEKHNQDSVWEALKGKKPLKIKCRRHDNIKTDHKKTGC